MVYEWDVQEFAEEKVPQVGASVCTAACGGPPKPFPTDRLRTGISSASSNIRKAGIRVRVRI